MTRPLRIIVPNIPLHVLDRGNNRQIVFRENEDFAYFLKILKRYKKEWSSYNFYAFGKTDPATEGLIDVDPYYLELGKSSQEWQERYRKQVKEVMEMDFMKNIREKLDGGVFGKPDFIRQMKEKFKIKPLRGKGRPKKNKNKEEEKIK